MIVSLAGSADTIRQATKTEFTAQARATALADHRRGSRAGEPMSQVYSYRQMANRWRHYEKWGARLDGFIALGDSSCAFNPVYGQGMTSAALSALILGECLEKNGINDVEVPRKFFAALARFQSEPWGLATAPISEFQVPRASVR